MFINTELGQRVEVMAPTLPTWIGQASQRVLERLLGGQELQDAESRDWRESGWQPLRATNGVVVMDAVAAVDAACSARRRSHAYHGGGRSEFLAPAIRSKICLSTVAGRLSAM